VGGFRRKRIRRGTVNILPASALSSEPPSEALFLSPQPPNPLRILPDPADVLPSQPFALLPPQSISSAECPIVHFGLSPSAQHIPLPSESTFAGCPAYPHPPDALPCLSCLQLPAGRPPTGLHTLTFCHFRTLLAYIIYFPYYTLIICIYDHKILIGAFPSGSSRSVSSTCDGASAGSRNRATSSNTPRFAP